MCQGLHALLMGEFLILKQVKYHRKTLTSLTKTHNVCHELGRVKHRDDIAIVKHDDIGALSQPKHTSLQSMPDTHNVTMSVSGCL